MARYSHVLVGYDGAEESERALRWAAEEAALRRLALSVCHAWHRPVRIGPLHADVTEISERMGRHVLEHGIYLAEEVAPRLQVCGRLLTGPASSALLHCAGDAALIVIGLHGPEELPLGATALQVASRADRPVVGIRPGRAPAEGRAVVGVDGSAGGHAALAFAFEEAMLRGWAVQAVHGAWEPALTAGESELSRYADADLVEREAGARLQRAVAPWREKYPQIEVWTSLWLKDPRRALLEAAEGADMVVVGARGAGDVRPLLLGSTSQTVLQHAPCPVTIVHR
ncbi:universal stress protein [Actinomadura craniellae]|uniref:Universal stress protein n=1 Tax=Actinomadura craniellae TaxID=2231787 RepID=A0A365H588_9ACTN|nr:universal stress protein [Actinomadura craniellae]RAY13393.1 universal stress protein [Actinomadura craniellae]